MATFTVWKFHHRRQGGGALSTLERLQSEELITVQDAAIVTWPEDKKKPKTRHLSDLTGAGALGGAFWGFLFGLIFFVPCWGWPWGPRRGPGRIAHAHRHRRGLHQGGAGEGPRGDLGPLRDDLRRRHGQGARGVPTEADAELIHQPLRRGRGRPAARRSPRRTEPPDGARDAARGARGLPLGLCGLVLVIGGAIALWRPVSRPVLGLVLAFGAGVDLGRRLRARARGLHGGRGWSGAPALGFFAGVATFFVGDTIIDRMGGEGLEHGPRRPRRRGGAGDRARHRPGRRAGRPSSG